MQNTFLLILITSLWTVGIFLATSEGEILHGVKVGFQKALGEKWSQPFISCPYCMPSVHGLLICATYHLYRYELYHVLPVWPWSLLRYLFVVVAASTFNYILYNLIRSLMGYASLYDGSAPCPEVSDVVMEIKKEEENE